MIPTPSLHYDSEIPLPDELFSPRRRTVLSRLGDAWPEPGRIGLPVPYLDGDRAAKMDARLEPDGRASVTRKAAVTDRMQPVVPLIAKRDFEPLRVEIIPSSSWASSLENLLDNATWRRLRMKAVDDAGGVCELCGSGYGRQECHEIWTWHAPLHSYDQGIQRLEGLICLCADCHEIFHPGVAAARGHRNGIIQRLCLLNAWSEAEYRRYAEWGNALTASRNKLEWELDLTPFADFAPFTIGPGWKLDLASNSIVSTPEKSPERRRGTRIIGVEWVIGDYRGNPIRSPLPPL